ncbi:MAG: hypothetical protein GXO89_00790 [Chlorobi bacterium]|nr:hypothetical protein [Chlorobiota bacterium]
MNRYLRYILFFYLFAFAIGFSYSQDSGSGNDFATKSDKGFSAYIDYPVLYKNFTSLFLFNVEMALIKRDRLINPAFSIGFGMGFSKYGVGPYAVPIEFKLHYGKSNNKIEAGFGIMPIGADVATNARFGFLTYLFRHLLLRLAYTPYFLVPYGDMEQDESYIDIKNDISIGIGYRF